GKRDAKAREAIAHISQATGIDFVSERFHELADPIPPEDRISDQRRFIAEVCFQEAMERTKRDLAAGAIAWSDADLPGLRTHDQAFDERMAARHAGVSQRLDLKAAVKRRFKADLTELRFDSADGEQIWLASPLPFEQFELRIGVQRIHFWGMGK